MPDRPVYVTFKDAIHAHTIRDRPATEELLRLLSPAKNRPIRLHNAIEDRSCRYQFLAPGDSTFRETSRDRDLEHP